jgi:hypothetical protein
VADPARLVAVLALALLLAQPLAGPASAHQGHQEHESQSESAGSTGKAPGWNPNATPVTPNERYVRQTDPEVDGSLVVWEQQRVGRDWDIVAANLSTDEAASPIATTQKDERDPTVRGPWIAWERHRGEGTVDLAVHDTRTGTTIDVPDTGHHQVDPVLGGGSNLFFVERDELTADRGHLRLFDLETLEIERPIGNHTIQGVPDARGTNVTWYEDAAATATIVIHDTAADERTELPDRWDLVEGPQLGPEGVSFVARHSGAQRGTYSVHFDLGTEQYNFLRSGIYPHANHDNCDAGVIWDQPGSPTSGEDHVTLWDRYIEEQITLGFNNTNPACSDTYLTYEKEVEADSEDLDRVPRVYTLQLENVRLQADATITLDPEIEDGIYSDTFNVTGFIEPGDPREPIKQVVVGVDGGDYRAAETERTDEGIRWSATIEADEHLSGKHTLTVATEDTLQSRTTERFTFYTDTPYTLDRTSGGGPDVPRAEPSPFPFNLLDHYKAYQPFYNTAFLVLALIVGGGYVLYRYRQGRPDEPPEYVPPEAKA